MKQLLLAALMAFSLTPVVPAATPKAAAAPLLRAAMSEIAWHTEPKDIVEVIKEADRSGKSVMLVYDAGWCPWCKKMDEDTFADDQVIALSREFTCIKIDTETAWGKALMHKQGISGLPCVVFYKDGEKCATVTGYTSPEKFLSEMRSAL